MYYVHYRIWIYGITISMEPGPSWRANSYSASWEIHTILKNSKVNFQVHKSITQVPILHQMNTAHTLSPYLFKVNFYTKILYALLIFFMYVNATILITLGEKYKLWSFAECNFIQPPTGKIIVFYTLILTFLDSRQEDISFWTEWYEALLTCS